VLALNAHQLRFTCRQGAIGHFYPHLNRGLPRSQSPHLERFEGAFHADSTSSITPPFLSHRVAPDSQTWQGCEARLSPPTAFPRSHQPALPGLVHRRRSPPVPRVLSTQCDWETSVACRICAALGSPEEGVVANSLALRLRAGGKRPVVDEST